MSKIPLETMLAQAQRWAEIDPDPETRGELEALLAANDTAAIAERFAGRLQFGTAGLRAELGAGPLRMNRVVVMQSTAGFAQFLIERKAAGKVAGEKITVVVGFDARKNSATFARDVCQVLAGYGLDAVLLPGPLPTPVTAFAVRHFDAAAGIMITASHNPPNDNGYKVYLGDADCGSQIIPPDDAAIAAAIEQVAAADFNSIKISDNFRTVSDFIITEYLAATNLALGQFDVANPVIADGEYPLPLIVYTAMHGVGYHTSNKLFELAQMPPLVTVPEQAQPDADFPTVSFPNPEEPGALDLAYKRAEQLQADLIIAHDPDADRLAVALPTRVPAQPGALAQETGETPAAQAFTTNFSDADYTNYKALSGNQLGLLLGWQAAKKARNALDSGVEFTEHPALACTIVSSPALQAVAKHYGLHYAETLSGFKWVSRVPGLVFGFEEALGYLVNPQTIRDKDGISASLALTQFACELHAAGRTLWDALDEAAELFGAYESDQVTLRLESAAAATALSNKLREHAPSKFGEFKVAKFTDLAKSSDTSMRANVLRFDLVGGSRVMVRPSGTEPKLKLYLDACVTEGTAAQRQAAAKELVAQLRSAVEELLCELNEF